MLFVRTAAQILGLIAFWFVVEVLFLRVIGSPIPNWDVGVTIGGSVFAVSYWWVGSYIPIRPSYGPPTPD